MSKCLRGGGYRLPKYLVRVKTPFEFYRKNEEVILSRSEYELHRDSVELIKKIEDINELSIIK